MDGNDNDVVMDGQDHLMTATTTTTSGTSTTNGFMGLDGSLDSRNGESIDGEDDEEELESGGSYPRELRERRLLATGLCYDDRMKLHSNADFGPNPHHPEDPSRIASIMATLKKAGLVYQGSDADLLKIIQTEPYKYMWRIPAREAKREEICLVHHPTHYTWVEELSNMSTEELRALSIQKDQGRTSLYVGSLTFEAALVSAGGAIETCKKVVEGEIRNGFAVIRPPGHHAEFDQAMGFCLFNNVPIAAKVVQKEYPDKCRKVLILDWDVHHGNGIQNMFYEDPNILYISLHVYENGEFYPGRPDNNMIPDGGMEHCGAGAGKGKNINIGWHAQGMGDGEYMTAFQKIVMPIALEFDPDLVIISAGFDAADGDELGACFVSPACYAHMTHMLMSLANGKVAVCLEGGYDLEAISNSALAVARTLMGEPPPRIQIPKLCHEAARVLAKVQAYQAPYWECMRPGIVDVQEMAHNSSSRLHDVVRTAERQRLSQEYGMIPLYVQRDLIYKSFENQVLATRDIHAAKRVMVIIHDPPALRATLDPVDASLDGHNAWATEGVSGYIDWAVRNKFGVMDINIPRYVTKPDDMDSHIQPFDERALSRHIEELMCYLWDNYLQLYDVEDLFLVGVGNSYLGIKLLLITRAYLDVKSKVSGVVSFVSNAPLRPVKSDVDEYLSHWYKDNSRVYVSNDHACWNNAELTRKVNKRRFGTVVRSKYTGLANMMQEHRKEVTTWILARSSSLIGVEDAQGETTEDDKMT
ncbi:histone deacetylase clr3 [Rhypophila sp. PSN 637]